MIILHLCSSRFMLIHKRWKVESQNWQCSSFFFLKFTLHVQLCVHTNASTAMPQQWNWNFPFFQHSLFSLPKDKTITPTPAGYSNIAMKLKDPTLDNNLTCNHKFQKHHIGKCHYVCPNKLIMKRMKRRPLD